MPTEKERIILRLNRKLTDKTNSDALTPAPYDYLTKASVFTGLHPVTLKELENTPEFVSYSFQDPERSEIYKNLHHFYAHYRKDGGKLPTTYELFDAMVKTNNMKHLDIGSFRKLLVKMDFIWKKVHVQGQTSIKTAVIIEKPLVRFERLDYFTKMRRCRIEKFDDIYFVDEVAYNAGQFMDVKTSLEMDGAVGVWQKRVVYAVGRTAVICPKEIKEFNSAEIENWIAEDLCSYLAQPSVIVIKNTNLHNATLRETPTLYSSRIEIRSWLDYHEVPYSADMSKYELYSLAEEYTDLETKLYKIDGILKARGHVVLRLPKSIEDLSPAALLFRLIKSNWERVQATTMVDDRVEAKKIFSFVIEGCISYLEDYTSSVIFNEKKMMAMDNDLDLTLDSLVIKGRDISGIFLERDDSDVASCSDSD